MDLEKHLEKENLNLYNILKEIKSFTEKVWADKKLYWFTNHDIKHSEEIIRLLGQLLDCFIDKSQFLTDDELFILLASAYLHDIGMQYLKDNGFSPENLTKNEYNKIRKEHSELSAKIVLTRAKEVIIRDDFILPDINDEYLGVISDIVKAHSTDYFDEVIEIFRNEPARVNNRKVRGEFLASLLMIGDEFDIQAKRADFAETRGFNLSDYSKMHWFKHHYVKFIEIEYGFIKIEFEFPKNSDNYKELIVDLIVDKLNEQINKVKDIFKNLVKIENIDKNKIKRIEDRHEKKRVLPSEVINYIEDELKKKLQN